MDRSRTWMFTLNNPEDTQAPKVLNARYCCWQLETGESGTPHLQGYVEFLTAMRLNALRKLLPCHWETRRGSQAQALSYVTKEDTRTEGPWEYGEKAEDGKRKDLKECAALAMTGCSKRQLVEHNPEVFIKYAKGLESIRTMYIKPRTLQTQGIYVYGLQNSGKTYLMKKKYPNAYWKDNTQWWDGYDGQSVVIWDEFQWDTTPINNIKQLLNHAPLKVQVKGSMIEFTSSLIIFLSNTKLDVCYENQAKADQDAWLSRLRSFEMENRVLIPKRSTLWEIRFNATHDDQLPDYESFNKE